MSKMQPTDMAKTAVSAETLIIFFGVFIALVGIYNIIMTGIKNHREAEERRNAPNIEMQEQIDAHQRMLASDKIRIENLERKTEDLTQGQKATVKGIQALLEHELHNGNADQLQNASQQISDWLTNR